MRHALKPPGSVAVMGNRRRTRRHYALHKEEYVLKRIQYRTAHPEAGILSRAKYRAKQVGVPFSLTEADIVIPAVCPVLGIPIIIHVDQKQGYHPDSPSIDRIEPGKGYVPSNIRMISARANLLKSNATVEELEKVLADLKKLRGVT